MEPLRRRTDSDDRRPRRFRSPEGDDQSSLSRWVRFLALALAAEGSGLGQLAGADALGHVRGLLAVDVAVLELDRRVFALAG